MDSETAHELISAAWDIVTAVKDAGSMAHSGPDLPQGVLQALKDAQIALNTAKARTS